MGIPYGWTELFLRELTALGNPLDTGAGREKRRHVSEEAPMRQTEMGSQKSEHERQEVGGRVEIVVGCPHGHVQQTEGRSTPEIPIQSHM